jgi:hypothetical protein
MDEYLNGFLPSLLIELDPRRERGLSRREQERGKRQSPHIAALPASGRPCETMKAARGDGALKRGVRSRHDAGLNLECEGCDDSREIFLYDVV